MKVLSLFDGMSCGQIALERAGIQIDEYYASEIDKHAIWVAKNNYPNTIHIGDVCNIAFPAMPVVDLLIGGSPCQGFSFAGKQLNFNDPRSKLFFQFVRILKEQKKLNPNIKFLLENVRMKQEFQDVITKELGVQPIMINSKLVSAQNRVRLYWTNIQGVTQPKDEEILLQDILENEVDEKYNLSDTAIKYMGRLRNGKPRWEYHSNPLDGKSACLTANMHKGVPYGVVVIPDLKALGAAQRGRSIVNGKRKDIKGSKTEQRIELNLTGKSNCLTSVQKDSLVLEIKEATKKGYTEVHDGECFDATFPQSKTRRGRLMKDKSNCLTATKFDFMLYKNGIIRKLTPVECERLQTVPDNYTNFVSDSQRYKMLGNGWTIDVVAHIFKNLL